MAESTTPGGTSGSRGSTASGSTTTPSADSGPTIAERTLVINLGEVKRKKLKQLRKGTGTLVDEIREAIQLASAQLGDDASGKVLVPAVVIYQEKGSKRIRRGGPNGMCPILCI
jgi:hypothetical protein